MTRFKLSQETSASIRRKELKGFPAFAKSIVNCDSQSPALFTLRSLLASDAKDKIERFVVKGFSKSDALQALLDELNRIVADNALLAKLLPEKDLFTIAQGDSLSGRSEEERLKKNRMQLARQFPSFIALRPATILDFLHELRDHSWLRAKRMLVIGITVIIFWPCMQIAYAHSEEQFNERVFGYFISHLEREAQSAPKEESAKPEFLSYSLDAIRSGISRYGTSDVSPGRTIDS